MATETRRFMAMKGDGYYSRSALGARAIMDETLPLLQQTIASMAPPDDTSVFKVTDMGSADGGTSVELWRQTLAGLRARVPSRPIEMIYCDLPRNDFSGLFRMIHGQTEVESYVPQVPNLFVQASATSFHDQIVPANTLDLGFSATASHYLSAVPCDIADHVHMTGASATEREAYSAQGRADWRRMLLARALELKRGGRLMLVNFGIDEQGRWQGHTGGQSVFDTFAEIWRAMAKEQRITGEEYRAANFPQVFRSRDEIVAPLEDTADAVHKAGLRLERIETGLVPCPYAAGFAQHRNAEQFARAYIPTLRSWSEPVFGMALSPERSMLDCMAILDAFYNRYERRVAAAPEGHGLDAVLIWLVCRKE